MIDESTIPSNSKNLLILAEVAAQSGNYIEAYKYYSMVLEINAENSDAWQKKGTSAGWLSNLDTLRFSEMITCHNKAIELAKTEPEKEIVKMTSAVEQLAIAKAIFELSTQHAIQFISIPNVKFDHVDRCKEIITLCENSLALDGDNPSGNQLIAEIASRFKSLSGLSQEEKIYFESKVRRHQSNQVAANINSGNSKNNSSDCFVITATMGDEKHPHVITLRKFRASVLSNYYAGRVFINWYEDNGPKLAKLIKSSVIARFISYLFVVIPSASIAHLILRMSREKNKKLN